MSKLFFGISHLKYPFQASIFRKNTLNYNYQFNLNGVLIPKINQFWARHVGAQNSILPNFVIHTKYSPWQSLYFGSLACYIFVQIISIINLEHLAMVVQHTVHRVTVTVKLQQLATIVVANYRKLAPAPHQRQFQVGTEETQTPSI